MLYTIKSIFFNWQLWLRLILAFFVPFLLLSSIMSVSEKQINEALGQQLDQPRLGLMGKEYVPKELLERLQNGINLRELQNKGDIFLLVEEDSLDIVLVFSDNFYADSNQLGTIEVYYNSIQNRNAVESVLDIVAWYKNKIVAKKIASMGLDRSVLEPILIQKNNTFSVFATVGKVLESVKGVLSNILNLLFVLLIIWLVRNLILRATFVGNPKNWLANLLLIFMITMLAMALTFIGFQAGMNIELEGMIKSLVLSVQQLLIWNRLSSFLILWWPTWLFIIGLLGWITATSKKTLSAYSITFWIVIFIHFIAIVGMFPTKELSVWAACFPIYNVFGVGQLAMKGILEDSTWWLALGSSCFWAVLVNALWYRARAKKLV